MPPNLQVIDFFCGAGGFSEGFRQQGFKIAMGIDNWAVAIQTHNLNHGLNDGTKDILDFNLSIDEIQKLPNTEVIVGSPPCVLFSLSNRGGKADKTKGIRLIEAFLRVVAVKKHQQSSNLIAWFMENVPNSKNYIAAAYTFRDLNLTSWAVQNNFDPDAIALNASKNGRLLNTADFGTSQKRERFVCGEIVAAGGFPELDRFMSKEHRSIGSVLAKMPPPNMTRSQALHLDPNYPSLNFPTESITDQFYDSGIYESQWRDSLAAKTNHPYMGKMSFPEDPSKPSRTIMATRSMTTREALIYRSEYERKGDGEYRVPTIREIATLMGFPYSYQFCGGENNKWRQIGNAVCPFLSAALAKSVRLALGLEVVSASAITFPLPNINHPALLNLNTFTQKKFDKPPKKKNKSRFRRHPFKDGNMTVALTNFSPTDVSGKRNTIKWYSSVFLGCGDGFIIKKIRRSGFKRIQNAIVIQHQSQGIKFIERFEKEFQQVIGQSAKFQEAYVTGDSSAMFEPRRLVDAIGSFILRNEPKEKFMRVPSLIPEKDRIPTRQVLAMYAINRIIS